MVSLMLCGTGDGIRQPLRVEGWSASVSSSFEDVVFFRKTNEEGVEEYATVDYLFPFCVVGIDEATREMLMCRYVTCSALIHYPSASLY